MRFSLAALAGALLTVAPALVHAQDSQAGQGQMVMVGMNGQLSFTPANINAPMGSNVTFIFMSKNHSIAQSSFADPCNTIPNGFQADYFPINNDTTNFPIVTIAVSQPGPIWVYCPQTNPADHCKMGMVAAINAPPDKTLETFQAIAQGLTPPPATNTTSSGTTVPGTTGTGTTGSGTTGSAIVPGTTGGPSTVSSPSTVGSPSTGSSASSPVVSPGSTASPSNNGTTDKNAALPRGQGALTAAVVGLLGVVASLL